MEELWKDMSLCSTPLALQSYHHSPAAAPYRGTTHPQNHLAGAVPQPPRTPPPHTALTCLGGTGDGNSATSSGDDPAGCHFGFAASGGASRRAVVQPAVGGDPRQRRMIKNRESAARSRARKQAHTNEMELELAQLRRENRMLIQREQDFINWRIQELNLPGAKHLSSDDVAGVRLLKTPKLLAEKQGSLHRDMLVQCYDLITRTTTAGCYSRDMASSLVSPRVLPWGSTLVEP